MTGPDTCCMARMAASRGLHAVLDVVLDGLDDHNGIVHDDADGQHQAKQRQVVQAEPHGRHEGEGADDGHGHRDQGDQCRTPVLQEHQHDDGHQDDRDEQRLVDLVDRLLDKRRCVINDTVIHARRETQLEFFHLGPDQFSGVEGVGPGQLVDRQGHRRFAVQSANLVIGLGAQLYPADVADVDVPLLLGLDDDVAELVLVGQPALRGHDVLEDLPPRHGRLADLTGCHLNVLVFDGRHNVADRQMAGGHLLRV